MLGAYVGGALALFKYTGRTQQLLEDAKALAGRLAEQAGPLAQQAAEKAKGALNK